MFLQDPFFDSKPPEIAFLMILSSVLEGVGGPGLLTFCFLVPPVANACMVFGSQLTSFILSVKSDVEESRNGCQCWWMLVVGKGRRQKRSQRREGEASPPSFERIRITYSARPATS